jgi:hypothetical protein
MQRSATSARLLRLTHLATATIEAALVGGNVAVALAVLRGTGLLDGEKPRIESDDPERLSREREQAQRDQRFLDSLRG